MQLNKFKLHFLKTLDEHYPNQEIHSFFNLLIEKRLELSRVDIALNPKIELKTGDLHYLKNSLNLLLIKTPIQYVIGETSFCGFTIQVNEHVLIPRPETEELVDWIVTDFKNRQALKLLDIGTGSGCIPIALSKYLEVSECHAIDASHNALNTALINAQNNKVPIEFIESDILNINKLQTSFDIIVSNPPYVLEAEKAHMDANVLNYEPPQALFVPNDDPLVFYKKIAQLALNGLNHKGKLFFEINQKYGDEVCDLLTEIGFRSCVLKKDIYGVDRMVRAEV